jgi:hypothetical protein
LTQAVVDLSPAGGMTAAVCAAVGVSRATVHRARAVLRIRPETSDSIEPPPPDTILR